MNGPEGLVGGNKIREFFGAIHGFCPLKILSFVSYHK
jgi:hypothetical protein